MACQAFPPLLSNECVFGTCLNSSSGDLYCKCNKGWDHLRDFSSLMFITPEEANNIGACVRLNSLAVLTWANTLIVAFTLFLFMSRELAFLKRTWNSFCVWLGSLFTTIASIIHIMNIYNLTLGVSVGVTMLTMVPYCLFLIVTNNALEKMIKSTLKYFPGVESQKKEKFIRVSKYAKNGIFALIIFINGMWVVMLINDFNARNVSFRVVCFLGALLWLYLGIIGYWLASIFISAIEKHVLETSALFNTATSGKKHRELRDILRKARRLRKLDIFVSYGLTVSCIFAAIFLEAFLCFCPYSVPGILCGCHLPFLMILTKKKKTEGKRRASRYFRSGAVPSSFAGSQTK